MGLFDFLKKKESHYDATNIRVHDLDVGFIFEYDLASWKVEAIYEYDWGDNFFTREYKVSDGLKTRYLSIEEDDELVITLTKKIKARSLGSGIITAMQNGGKAPNEIVVEGETYFLEGESPGYFHDIASGDNWEEFVSYNYEDEKGEKVICIEQWSETKFEASKGVVVKEFEISNILPASD